MNSVLQDTDNGTAKIHNYIFIMVWIASIVTLYIYCEGYNLIDFLHACV